MGKPMFMCFLSRYIDRERLFQSCPPHCSLIGTVTPSHRINKFDKLKRSETKLGALVSQI